MHERDKNIAQFTAEYGELFPYISRFVAFRIPAKDVAEDIVSDVFLSGYTRLASFDAHRGNLRQWLTGIAKHQIADYWRTQRPTVGLEEAERLYNQMERLSADNALDASQKIQEILTALTPEARALFTLRYIDGHSHKEIAHILHKKPSTVRTFFSRMQTAIRQSHQL